MATRQKKTVIVNVSREQADDAFASYAKSEARINKIQAEIELQCAKAREKFQNELAVLTAERDKSFDILHAFATENQSELFTKKKSLEMAHGTIGFRLELVKTFLPSCYVRQTEEIAKDKLLSDRDLEDVKVTESGLIEKEVSMKDAMAKCGIQVVQDETFYVEPKKEDVDR